MTFTKVTQNAQKWNYFQVKFDPYLSKWILDPPVWKEMVVLGDL